MSKSKNGEMPLFDEVDNNGDLPEGWAKVAIPKIANIHSGQTPSGIKDSLQASGDIPWFKVGDMNRAGNERFMDNGENFLTNESVESLRMRIFPPNTLIFPKRGGAIATNKKRMLRSPACLDLNIMALVLPEEYASYCWWWFQTIDLARLSDGSNVPQINNRHIVPLKIPLAPLPEQKRIVSKIEELFSDLDAGVSALERARANLRRYRASVLKSAVEGRLTQKWRSANPDVEPASELLARILRERRQRWEQQQLTTYESKGKKPPKNWQTKYKEPVEPDQRNLPEVPDGWAVASMDQLTEIITSGSRAWSKYYGSGTGTFIMAQNVRPGRLDLNFRQPVNPPEGDRDRTRSQIKLGDLLVTIVGANTGDVCRVPEELPEHYVCQSVALMRPVDASISEYLETYFVADEGAQKQFEKYIYGAGRPHLSFDQLKMTAILLPPLSEQHAVLEASESRFPSIDHTDAMLRTNLARANRLRQGILKSAFEGNLTAACLNGG
ncbi:restriction endonuclease subunit S [Neorhodopirellula lusitana]|uniref:restriction endonuclease subunit S n=1 Tax=Neorhodopirellula lusitana TaxID=445327 RepID=UPI00384D7BB1